MGDRPSQYHKTHLQKTRMADNAFTRWWKRYQDFIIVMASLAALVAGGWLFADALENSQAELKLKEDCQMLRDLNGDFNEVGLTDKKYMNNPNIKIEDCPSEFQAAEKSLEVLSILEWLGSMILAIAGILGLVFFGHRCTHEMKHFDEATAQI